MNFLGLTFLLYLTPHALKNHAAGVGNGLYLKRGDAVHNGEGLILGKTVFLKMYPFLDGYCNLLLLSE